MKLGFSIFLAVFVLWPFSSASGSVRAPIVVASPDDSWIWVQAGGGWSLAPNRTYSIAFTPNDPQYSLQWNFTTIGMASAWSADSVAPVYGGDPGVVVAVVDTGLAYESFGGYVVAPEIAGAAVWTNSGEIADGIDNDANGYVDDLHGWDFVNADAHPNDDHGHGTHVAGTIGGATDNGIATAGIAFASRLMPLKALSASGLGTTATLVQAVNYAVANGADIINLSLGGQDPDPVLEQALSAAVAQGLTVIAAAGNDGDGSINYPARYASTIAVGATQYDDARAPYSDSGPELDLVAPGGNLNLDQNSDGQPDGILQQTCTSTACNSFGSFWYTGTSQAAAHVSGVAALLAACGAPPGAIRTILDSTAVDLGAAGRDDQYGAGRINAAAAVQAAGCQSTAPAAPQGLVARSFADGPTLRQFDPYPYRAPVFQWGGLAGMTYRVSWGKTTSTPVPQTQTATTFTGSISTPGTYRLSITAVDAVGRSSPTVTFVYRFHQPALVIAQRTPNIGVRLYTPAPALIRHWPSGLGEAPVLAAGGRLGVGNELRLAIMGSQAGTSLKVKNTLGQDRLRMTPFGANFSGSISATIVRHRDGRSWIVAATRQGGASLRWHDPAGTLVRRQTIYATYRDGLNLASGDLDGDGTDELVVTMRRGHEVRVYDWQGRRLRVLTPLGAAYSGGWLPATGDRTGDGADEILLVPNAGGTAIPVFIIAGSGQVVDTWRVRLGRYSGPIVTAATDGDGDGVDELYIIPARGNVTLYEYELNGVRNKATAIRSDGFGAWLTALE